MALYLPKLLDIPAKLLRLADPDVFNLYRIFLLEGGRGGSKSQTIARLLLYLGDKYKLRIACGRETQNSISESVHALLADLIVQYQLDYDVQSSKITHRRTGTTFTFIGLREQGRFNIQGIEGVDILWIEEGQAITKPTMDVVLPTIRKAKSRIFISMNRHVANDPAYWMTYQREDCLHIHINYLENEHCTHVLKNEAEVCRRQSEKDYEHIWLGKPLDQSEDALYSISDFENGKKNAHALVEGYGIRVGGFDIARFGDDKCAAFVWQQMGALHWEEVFCDEWDHRDLNYTTGRILTITNQWNLEMAAIDEDGMGAGPFDTLTQGRRDQRFVGFRNPPIGYQENNSFGNIRTVNAYKLKDALSNGHRCVKTQKVIDEFLTIKYTFDHSQRRILVPKDVMKTKFKLKSPNLADAAIMAESLIGQIKYNQLRQYEPNMQQYSKEDNLFRLAGV